MANITLEIEGMSCGSCVGRVEAALSKAHGVTSATVNLAAQTAYVSYAVGDTAPHDIMAQVSQAGYPASLQQAADTGADRQATEAKAIARDLKIAAILTLPVFVVEMGSHFVPGVREAVDATIGSGLNRVLQFVIVTCVLLWPGRVFFQRGIPALLKGAPDMNALVAIGTFAAWGYSSLVTFVPDLFPQNARVVYFEAAAVIVTLILLGRYFEARAKGRTGAAIRNLINLQPKTAMLLRDGQAVEVALEAIKLGDVLRVRPGERVALDGVVNDGQSYVDESMISGEPVPVAKAAGDSVTGGTMNGNGTLSYTVTKIGEATMLAQIIRMVRDAQGAKLPIQDLVNKITMWFVPVVLVLATLTVLFWLMFGPAPVLSFALVAGVSVLIVACPCAMGLATPTSIMVGTGRAAEMGVLFRKSDALQALNGAKVVAFDKTGTLTQGKPELTTFVVQGQTDSAQVLQLIASVEAVSEHPIALAIVASAKKQGLTLLKASSFDSETGFGVRAIVDGKHVAIGADRMMQQGGIALASLQSEAADIAADGQTPIFAAIDGQLAALMGVSDPIKDSARAAIGALQQRGITVAMITGDNVATAKAVADQLGIDQVLAEMLPQDKSAAVVNLRAEHGPVAFVGDGINDAPALAAADVGIAIGTGTDVAIESADVVLMSGDLSGVTNAFEISRATMRNIRQNLFWAFAYNVMLIPVAAGALYIFGGPLLSPMLAAGAMALSSVFVLSNALRLRWVRRQSDGAFTGALS